MRARLDHHLLSLPVKINVETRKRTIQYRTVNAGLTPVAPAVQCHVDPFDRAPARPRQTGEHVLALVFERCLRRWVSHNRFRIHDKCEAARTAIRHQIGVFGGLFAGQQGHVDNLQPPQPFDPHIAFPTRHHETNGITLLRPQHFTVHAESNDAIIQRLGDGD